MRSWLSLFLLAPALLAQVPTPETLQQLQRRTLLIQQSPAQSPLIQPKHAPRQRIDLMQPAQPPSNGERNFWRMPSHVKTFFGGQPAPKTVAPKTVAPKKVCSIPLVNALKRKPDTKFEIMAIPLPAKNQRQHSMFNVTPPAPPCDDEKR
jgi:hypothetical protein